MKCPVCKKNNKVQEMNHIPAYYMNTVERWVMSYFICPKCGTLVR